MTFGRLGLLRSCFRIEGVAKTNFSQESFIMDIGVDFCHFLEALGAVFLSFVALETMLKIYGFSRGCRIQSSMGGAANVEGYLILFSAN